MEELLKEIRQCTICKELLPHNPRPVLSASRKAKVLIIGQAPGRKVHESGIPWDDKSGELLRQWLGVSDEVFYDPEKISLVPMGFCYPGKGKSGDLPPRPECAEAWHDKLMKGLTDVKLTVIIGQYAQAEYLKERRKRTLTDTVRSFEEYIPELIPIPHPSPRNRIWLKKNLWFESDLLPVLKDQVRSALS